MYINEPGCPKPLPRGTFAATLAPNPPAVANPAVRNGEVLPRRLMLPLYAEETGIDLTLLDSLWVREAVGRKMPRIYRPHPSWKGLLMASGATVWFSETEVGLGKSLLREIDRGLAMSRIGIVLATPALLESLKVQGVADKELSALLATDRVIPIAHGTTFEAVREVSPLLAARSGLTIGDGLPMEDAAEKIAAAAAAEGDGTTVAHTSRDW